MKYYNHRVATYRREFDHKVIDTREGWAKKGFVPILRRKGEVMYTNGYFGRTAEYFYDYDVKEDRAAADRYLVRIKKKRNSRRRQLHRTKKDRVHAREIEALKERFAIEIEALKEQIQNGHDQAKRAGYWRGLFAASRRFLVFDVETTGLDDWLNDMLSLSYQLVEFKRFPDDGEDFVTEVVERGDFYFDWPVDESRVTDKAIAINGLSKERLAELGTTNRKTALEAFGKALYRARVAVAHNASFDVGAVKAAAEREGVEIKWPKVYGTMANMTEYCALEWYEGADEYKWPRLEELALCLKVDTEDIEIHQPSANVELTKRCFLNIIAGGLDWQ